MANDNEKTPAKMGRKSKDTPEARAAIAEALRNGDTYELAANKGGIAIQTFKQWLAEKPDFAALVKNARAEYEEWELNGILADAKKSLKVLICGQEYDETKTEYEQDPRDPGQPRIKRQTVTRKKVLPSATAVIFALCNRDPEHWQNRVSNEITGKLESDSKNDISLKNVPDELLAQVIEAISGK